MDLLQGLKPLSLDSCYSQDHPTVLPLLNSSLEADSHYSSPSPVSKLLEELSLDDSITEDSPDIAIVNGKADDESYTLVNGNEKEEALALPSPAQSHESSPIKQKAPPPAVSKKPKFSLVPPVSPQTINKLFPSQQEETNIPQTEDQVDSPRRQTKEEVKEVDGEHQEEREDTLEHLAERKGAFTETRYESCITTSVSKETSNASGLYTNGEADEEEEEDCDGTSSTTGSISSKDDEAGESDS